MTPKQIKIILLEKDLRVNLLAAELGCRRDQLSMCIHRIRKYPELRKKLAKRLKIAEEVLFAEATAESATVARQ